MAADDVWKEQLTLISGNFLVWGTFLLKLWPFAAGLQTSENVHFLSAGGPKGEDVFFKFLTDTMAVAVGVAAVASFHILCRGIWLTVKEEQLKTPLNTICLFTFNATILLVVLLLFGSFLAGPTMYLQLWVVTIVMSHLGWSYNVANGLGAAAATVLLLVFLKLLIKSVGKRFGKHLRRIKPAYLSLYALVVIGSLLLGFIVLEGCYTLDLKTNAAVYRQERGDVIEIYVTLGGATSSVSDAKLKLTSSSSSSEEDLPVIDVGEGRYVAYIFSSKLSQGAYKLSLDYPHASLGLFYPFIQFRAHKSLGFIVIGN